MTHTHIQDRLASAEKGLADLDGHISHTKTNLTNLENARFMQLGAITILKDMIKEPDPEIPEKQSTEKSGKD